MKKMEQKQKRDAKKSVRNSKEEDKAMDDRTTLFGFAKKHLGNGMFLIDVQDEKHREHIYEVTAKAVRTNIARIMVNDVVIVSQSGKHFELEGNMSRKNIKHLISLKRIPSSFMGSTTEEDEGGIEFEVEEARPTEDVDIDTI
jgi:translation initiation factor IF-1